MRETVSMVWGLSLLPVSVYFKYMILSRLLGESVRANGTEVYDTIAKFVTNMRR